MKPIAFSLIAIFAGFVAAQVPASLPSSAPSADHTAQTAPAPVAAEPAPQTASANAATAPATFPATSQAGAAPAVPPSANPTTAVSTLPATEPASTAPSGYGTSGSSYRPFSSYSAGYSPSGFGPRDSRFNSPPTTSSVGGVDFTPKPYPPQYNALLSRSIFVKGSQRVVDTGQISLIPTRRDSMPTTNSTQMASSSGSENILVFNGASNANGQMIAFIENTGMNQISRYHAGDPVGQGAAGKITAITLDSIEYSVGPRVTHVNLGQNLNGQDVQILTTQPVGDSVAAPGASGTTQPSSPGNPPGLSDIERRLRERRMKELGQ